MKLLKSWNSASLKESQKVASELSKIFSNGAIVLMEGTLGSGKTFLVQNICKHWNIREEVTSPTFTLIQNYSGDKQVNHMDFYRLENSAELDQLGWEELLFSEAVSFIEWPEKIEGLLTDYYKIKITYNNNSRIIELYKS